MAFLQVPRFSLWVVALNFMLGVEVAGELFPFFLITSSENQHEGLVPCHDVLLEKNGDKDSMAAGAAFHMMI